MYNKDINNLRLPRLHLEYILPYSQTLYNNHSIQIEPYSQTLHNNHSIHIEPYSQTLHNNHSIHIEPYSQTLHNNHSIQIEPHLSTYQESFREDNLPQAIPSIYSSSASPNNVACFSYSPLQEWGVIPQFHSQHPDRIEPHSSVLLRQRMYSPIPASCVEENRFPEFIHPHITLNDLSLTLSLVQFDFTHSK